MARLKLEKLVPKLEFYGTGDESYELFRKACGFCYSLVGLGEQEKAEIVYQWAKEMADASKKWYMEVYPLFDLEESKKAVVGCGHIFDREKMKYCSECGKKAWVKPELDIQYGIWDYD